MSALEENPATPSAPRRERRHPTTGDPGLDETLRAFVTDLPDADAEIALEIITTALKLAREPVTRLDRKIVNSALKEMRTAFRVFAPYRHVRKVSVFGSSRTEKGDAEYEVARDFAKQIAERGWMVITGAGPGIMEAGHEGAGGERSFGANIRLPFEAKPNPVIAEDPKLINFKYFFTRKLMFMKEASAFVLLPGGFGTMDEAFEVLTLMQTGKSDMHPIVFLDAPGGDYWEGMLSFVRRDLVGRGYVSEPDLRLLYATDDVERAADEICHFYDNFHSMRFVGDRLVLRVQHAPDDVQLAELTRAFSDILVDDEIERCDPFPAEVHDDDALDKARLAMRFDRASYGRLRELIDRLNEIGA